MEVDMLKNIIIAILLSGCTLDEVEFAHRSTLETRARGVGLHHSGAFAQVGMIGNTCEIQTSTGFIGTDLDVVAGEEDKVEDTFDSLALVTGTSGNQLYVLDRSNYSSYFIDSDNVDQARFYNDGVVVLDDCNLTWISTEEERVSSEIPCGETLTVDHLTGTAFVATTAGLVTATPDGSDVVEVSGSLLAFDSSLGVLYVGELGESIVSGIQNGQVIWSTDLGQPTSSLDDMGIKGMAAVMVGDLESGGVVTVAGLSGEIVSVFETPSTADSITVSGDGSVIAITLPDEVHFYTID